MKARIVEALWILPTTIPQKYVPLKIDYFDGLPIHQIIGQLEFPRDEKWAENWLQEGWQLIYRVEDENV